MTPIETVGVPVPLFISSVLLTVATVISGVRWLSAHIDRAVTPVAKQVEHCTARLNEHDRLLDRLGRQNEPAE